MNASFYYHNLLHDTHAIEHQVVTRLTIFTCRLTHYPDLRIYLRQYLEDKKKQHDKLNSIIDCRHIPRSVLKDAMSRLLITGQAINDMLNSDDIVKGVISSYAFEQFEIASYTALITTAEKAGDAAAVSSLRAILEQERATADWLLQHLAQTTVQFMQGTPSQNEPTQA